MNTEQIKISILKSSYDYKEFSRKLKLKNNKDTMKELFCILNIITNKQTHNNKSIFDLSYKIISFIKYMIIDDDSLNNELTIKEITDQKNKLIKQIKKVNKKDRIDNSHVTNLRNIVNSIEELELALLFNDIKDDSPLDTSIVSQIIFSERKINPSKYLISNYPYIINSFNNNGANIVSLLVDAYLDALSTTSDDNLPSIDLFYFDNILTEVLNTKKINIPLSVISESLEKAKRKIEDNKSIVYNLWLKNLTYILTNKKDKFTFDEIDLMYNTTHKEFKDTSGSELLILNKEEYISNSDYIISIDGERTIVRDDSFSIKLDKDGNYILKIFIANPNNYFDIKSAIMQDARYKCESIYYEDSAKHMLPTSIVSNYLSLDQNMIRPTRVYEFKIDKNANIIDFKIEKMLVKVNNNLTYTSADNIINNSSNNYDIDNSFYLILSLLNEFSRNKNNFTGMSGINNSESLIASLMFLNNSYIAQYFKEHGFPFVYRGQTIYKDLKFLTSKINANEKIAPSNFEKIIFEIDNVNMNPFYSLTPVNHNGLGIDCYGSITSPLRRYVDILSNYCEDLFYFKKLSDKEIYDSIDFIKNEVDFINKRHIEIEQHYKKRKREI